MKNSVNWVSLIKFIGISAVILGHMNNPFNQFIYSWHMPLFFFLSGFFQKTFSFFDFRKNIFVESKKLMIPYFIFCALGLSVQLVKVHFLGREPLNLHDELFAIFFWMNYEELKNTYGFVLWFLPALLWAKVIFLLIDAIIKNHFIKSAVFLLLLLYSASTETILPFGISSGLGGAFWLFAGRSFFNFIESATTPSQEGLIYSVSVGAGIAIFLLMGPPLLDMSRFVYEAPLVNVFWALSVLTVSCISAKWICKKIELPSFIIYWGRNTMILFLLHPYTNNIAHLLIARLDENLWFIQFLLSVFFLKVVLVIKRKNSDSWFFKYV